LGHLCPDYRLFRNQWNFFRHMGLQLPYVSFRVPQKSYSLPRRGFWSISVWFTLRSIFMSRFHATPLETVPHFLVYYCIKV
jgi:hypothetical protein